MIYKSLEKFHAWTLSVFSLFFLLILPAVIISGCTKPVEVTEEAAIKEDAGKAEILAAAEKTRRSYLTPEGAWITARYTVKSGDSLHKIAKKYYITPQIIKDINGIESDVIYPGMILAIPKANFRIDINLSEKEMFLYSAERVFAVYPVGIGKDDSTPLGDFTIVNKLIDPVWYNNGEVIPAGDPKNLLGSRWMGFSIDSYGIHGTTEPESIGKANSEGCIRMHKHDLEELFDWITIGTPVRVHKS